MNRAAIDCWKNIQDLSDSDPDWNDVKIVLQVHDELILEGPEHLSGLMASILRHSMEDTVAIPGVGLIAEPKIAKNLKDLK